MAAATMVDGPQRGLHVVNLSVEYRDTGLAVRHVSLHVSPGEIVGIWGPNGAGKTTLLSTVAGMPLGAKWRIRQGQIAIDGVDIGNLAAHQVRRSGVSLIDGRDNVFGGLTVLENLSMVPSQNTHLSRDLERVWAWFPQLARLRSRLAGHLSGGERQMLAVARGTLGGPKVLLADEVSNGLSPKMISEVLERLVGLAREEKLSLLVAEQQVHLLADVMDRSYVLENGSLATEFGKSAVEESRLIRSYFGNSQQP
jgi:branched-chain amino acid transport system ATP-binding protein